MSPDFFEKLCNKIKVTKFQIALTSSVLALLLTISTLFSQATIPVLPLSEYNKNQMSEVYGQSYFMNSLSAWTDQVNYYQGLIRASWEASADDAIQQYVDTITTSDAYNDVAAYKDYVSRTLESQKLDALVTWEDRANLDLLQNRNEFIAKLNSGRVDELYLNRLSAQNSFSSYITTGNPQVTNQLNSAWSQWDSAYQERYEAGNYDFMNSMNRISGNYNDILAALDASDQAFQDNLREIDLYKKNVKNAISGMIAGFEADLSPKCEKAEGCAYKYGNSDNLNTAGLLLTDLITQIKAKLDEPSIDTTFSLTDLANQMNVFLNSQKNGAVSSFNSYDRLVNTYQTSIYGSEQLSVYDTDLNALIQDIKYGNYDSSYSRGGTDWLQSPDYNNEPFGKLPAGYTRQILTAIQKNNMADLKSIIEENLGSGGPLTVVAGSITANIYAKDFGMANKTAAGDIFAWTGVGHGGYQCHWPSTCSQAPAFTSNKLLDDQAGVNYSKYNIYRGSVPYAYQMDHVAYGLVYQMHNQDKEDYANYWSGVAGSLSGQVDQYEKNITPAIFAWETQVKNYQDFYTNWKVQAEATRAQAKLDADAALSQLALKRQEWNAKIENEYRDGKEKWVDIARLAQTAKSEHELSQLQSQVNSNFRGLTAPSFSTETGAVLATYEASTQSLVSREFTFTETQPSYQDPGLSVGFGGYVKTGLMEIVDGTKSFTSDIMDRLTTNPSLLSGVAGGLGASSSEGSAVTTKSYSIFGASEERKIDTGLAINGKDFGTVLQTSVNGVYQYSQLLSVNENNDLSVIAEQKKIINQMAYGVKWSDRSVAQYNESGEFVSNPNYANVNLKALLKELTNSDKYKDRIEACQSVKNTTENCFESAHADQLSQLKKLGLEYQDGMIVRSLNYEERFRLGRLEKAEFESLSQAQKEEMGSCYVNPTSCSDLLRKDFKSDFDEKSKTVSLSRDINNGRVVGRNSDGKYISGTELVSRDVVLTSVKPVVAPAGKDLFDVWGQEDWTDVGKQAQAVMASYYNNSYKVDNARVANAVSDIRGIESTNEQKFQKEKQAKETADSLIKDLVLAYLSGGIGGIKGVIQNKIEETINTSLATAWARASGADEDQIGMLTQALSFMRGRQAENKIKARMTEDKLKGEGTFALLTGGASKFMLEKTGASGFFAPIVAAGMTAYRTVAGDGRADAFYHQLNGGKERLLAIQSERESLVQSNLTQAIAYSTGIAPDLLSNMISDYKGSKAASRVRRAVNSNPFLNIQSQVSGVVGGIWKTAFVAAGVPERVIQERLVEANDIAFSGTINTSAQVQSLAYLNQALGMKAPGTSYTSAVPSFNDQRGLVRELGQQAVVEVLSAGKSREEREVINATLRSAYGSYERRRSEDKAQTEAGRSTAITAVTTGLCIKIV